MQDMWIWSLGREDPLEKKVATHSSVLAWEIPWTEEPGGLEPMGSQRVGHDWAANSQVTCVGLCGHSVCLVIQYTYRSWVGGETPDWVYRTQKRTEKSFIKWVTLNSNRHTSIANGSLPLHFIASLFYFSKCFPQTILIPACETWHKVVSMMYMFIF